MFQLNVPCRFKYILRAFSMLIKDIYDSMRKTHYGTFPYSISSDKSRSRYESPDTFRTKFCRHTRMCAHCQRLVNPPASSILFRRCSFPCFSRGNTIRTENWKRDIVRLRRKIGSESTWRFHLREQRQRYIHTYTVCVTSATVTSCTWPRYRYSNTFSPLVYSWTSCEYSGLEMFAMRTEKDRGNTR